VLLARLSVLALVAVAVTAALAIGSDRGPGKPVATKYGVTSQGRAFELKVDDEGRPVALVIQTQAVLA